MARLGVFVVLGADDRAERVAYYASYSEKRLRAELRREGVSFIRIIPASELAERVGGREMEALIKLIEAIDYAGQTEGIGTVFGETLAFFFDQGRYADRELDES